MLADDHTLFRDGVRRLLEAEADFAVVGEASDAAEALEKVRELRPHVVLMDIGMPGMSSFEAARLMRRDCPETRVIFLTMHEDDSIDLHEVESQMHKDQAEVLAKMKKITPIVKVLGALSGAMILVIAGLFIYQGLNSATTLQ